MKRHVSTRERPNGSERPEERGEAPDDVVLVELLPREADATAKRVASPDRSAKGRGVAFAEGAVG